MDGTLITGQQGCSQDHLLWKTSWPWGLLNMLQWKQENSTGRSHKCLPHCHFLTSMEVLTLDYYCDFNPGAGVYTPGGKDGKVDDEVVGGVFTPHAVVRPKPERHEVLRVCHVLLALRAKPVWVEFVCVLVPLRHTPKAGSEAPDVGMLFKEYRSISCECLQLVSTRGKRKRSFSRNGQPMNPKTCTTPV